MIDLLPAIIGGATTAVSYFVGLSIGKRNPHPAAEHVHTWTQWIKTDADKQERFCHGCGLTEITDPTVADCPPHIWGKWVEVPLTKGMGQERLCDLCGIAELRKIIIGAGDL